MSEERFEQAVVDALPLQKIKGTRADVKILKSIQGVIAKRSMATSLF
jgi:hypothetical protein